MHIQAVRHRRFVKAINSKLGRFYLESESNGLDQMDRVTMYNMIGTEGKAHK